MARAPRKRPTRLRPIRLPQVEALEERGSPTALLAGVGSWLTPAAVAATPDSQRSSPLTSFIRPTANARGAAWRPAAATPQARPQPAAGPLSQPQGLPPAFFGELLNGLESPFPASSHGSGRPLSAGADSPQAAGTGTTTGVAAETPRPASTPSAPDLPRWKRPDPDGESELALLAAFAAPGSPPGAGQGATSGGSGAGSTPADQGGGSGTLLTPLGVGTAVVTNPGVFATGTDAGGPAHVKVWNAVNRTLRFSIDPFPNTFHGGARVAVGDVNGDGTPDVIAAQGPGGSNRVRVFNGLNGNAFPGALGNFQAYASGQANGVFVASADVNADGKADIITGPENGPGPVKVFSGVNGSLLFSLPLTADPGVSGVRVAAGDVNGDGKADVITANGPGGLPRVCVFDGATRAELYNFFASDSTSRGGVYVAAGDVDGDGKADVIAG